MDADKEKRFRFQMQYEQEQSQLQAQKPQESLLNQATDISQRAQDAVIGPIARGVATGAQALSREAFGTEAPANVLGQGIQAVGQGIKTGEEYVSGKLGEWGVNPYVAGAVPIVAEAAASMMLPGLKGAKYSSKLGPAVGKPGFAARIKQMRTGVEAGEFERLRRDPTAFFSTQDRSVAGKAIGEAKEAAGIDLGVTPDIKSLTPENIAKARNLQGTANKAQDAIIAKLEKAQELQVQPGSNVGDPYALFDYNDPITGKSSYKIYGDPNIHGYQTTANVPFETLKQKGIPVTGQTDKAAKLGNAPLDNLPTENLIEKAGISPDEVSTALEGVNKRLTRLERSEGAGSPSFQKWSAIKSHFQNILEKVAPDVKEANKNFSRVALRDKFMEPFPVNQAGTMSKISAFGGAPLVGGVGASLAGWSGAAIGAATYQAARSPFVAGLGTAARGLLDKAVDPLLSRVGQGLYNRGAYASFIDKVTTRENSR